MGTGTVSIHAFRGEGDIIGWINGLIDVWFQSTPSGGKATASIPINSPFASVSIHAFRGEGDTALSACWRVDRRFQSTPSGGKATSVASITPSSTCFNPRLPGGRRPAAARDLPSARAVSIHAFRGEGDFDLDADDARQRVSIHAFRGEGDVVRQPVGKALHIVSIHAFRGEGDMRFSRQIVSRLRFNPRLPGGRRPCCSTSAS